MGGLLRRHESNVKKHFSVNGQKRENLKSGPISHQAFSELVSPSLRGASSNLSSLWPEWAVVKYTSDVLFPCLVPFIATLLFIIETKIPGTA